ncbi:MAG: hypothetical protein HW403_69 [Dehalococcoidia bacterium]|nr:hypothetical protein [Dehalococcoidia bacterium]
MEEEQPGKDSRNPHSSLEGPDVNQSFAAALNDLVAAAKQGQPKDSEFFNPPDQWLINHMRIFQDLPADEQRRILQEYEGIRIEAAQANAEGRAAQRAGPDVTLRLDSGGLAFFSQLGIARRPDLTQYFIDGFLRNRDAVAFSEASQELFAEALPYLTAYMKKCFERGDTIVQSDRQVCDAPKRSFHARQLLSGTKYLQIPYMWRQLTFNLPQNEMRTNPDILELSFPHWPDDLGLPADLKERVKEAGLTRLVFKAPTKGLSLHLGFDYVGEHKMGPLSIAMFLVKQKNGLALQAALSVARVGTIGGDMTNVATITAGPSLHGKSTITIMIEPRNSELAGLLGLSPDPSEGVYPMNDDIILLQPLAEPVETTRHGKGVKVPYGIDGTEDNFYAVPFGLTVEDDPITHHVLRGTDSAPNQQETLENVLIDFHTGIPDFLQNPTRNMRMILSRPRLVANKGAQSVLEAITGGQMSNSVHVPVHQMDRVLWQGVMRQNTVVPPLRRLNLKQYVRVLMYGEAVQMGAASGAIGRPYIEYFSDPFIIGLEDENANLLYHILQEMESGGQRHEYYVFNTGGIGAETNEEASGPRYKKIPREFTLMLQEALLREAVKFEYDNVMGADLAVAIVNRQRQEIVDLRTEWLPRAIYGEAEYKERVAELTRRRYYGYDGNEQAGILRYTKVTDELIDPAGIPTPLNEWELARLLSFFWHVDMAYNSLVELAEHLDEGTRPPQHLLNTLRNMYTESSAQGLVLRADSRSPLKALGIID